MIERLNRFRREPFLLFLDESFRDFFGLRSCNGHICFGCVALPKAEYVGLAADLRAVYEDYVMASRDVLKLQVSEWKSSVLNRLPVEFRESVFGTISDSLLRRGGVVCTYFAPVEGIVTQRLREKSVARKMRTIVKDDATYNDALQDLLREPINTFESSELSANYLRAPGQFRILSELVFTAFTPIDPVLYELNSSGELFYDPREAAEDEALMEHLQFLQSLLSENLGMMRIRSFSATARSEVEIGLQIADLIAGECRRFFVANSLLLTIASSRNLIPLGCMNDRMRVNHHNGEVLSLVRQKRLSQDVADVFCSRDFCVRFLLPVLAPLGVVCHTLDGECRRFDLEDMFIEDEMDAYDPYGEYRVSYRYDRKILREFWERNAAEP